MCQSNKKLDKYSSTYWYISPSNKRHTQLSESMLNLSRPVRDYEEVRHQTVKQADELL